MVQFIGLLVYEYIGNHIINSIPFAYIRYLFYKYIIKIKCDKSVYFQMGIYVYSNRGELSIGGVLLSTEDAFWIEGEVCTLAKM